jgi:hypothetical protein
MSVRRSIVFCALFIVALSATPALAGTTRSAARAQERYYQSFGTEDGAALAQERYYSSYGAPESLRGPQQVPAPSDENPIPVILITAAALLGLVGVGVQLRHVRSRRAPSTIS